MTITYKGAAPNPIKVYLSGKHVGTIVKLAYNAGYVYGAKGGGKGKPFPTLAEVKQSIQSA